MSELVTAIRDGLVAEMSGDIYSQVHSAVKHSALKCKASDVMTFVSENGRKYKPEADIDYAKALYHFVRQKPFNGSELDSGITEQIMSSVEGAVVKVLNSDKAKTAIVGSVTGSSVQGDLRTELKDDAKWFSNEMLTAAGVAPVGLVVDNITELMAQSSAEVVNSAAGKTIIASILGAATTTAGKAVITKLIAITTTKIAGSTVLKATVMGTLKKLGIAFLIKAVVVKVLAVAFPALVSMKIPLFWVLVPIIGAFLVREMLHLPKKLSEKLPNTVASEVRDNFPEIAEKFAEAMVSEAVIVVAKANHDAKRR